MHIFINPRRHRQGGQFAPVRSSSSMVRACVHQPYNASQHPPSLPHYDEAVPNEASISTGLAGRFSDVPLLEEDSNGVLVRVPDSIGQPVFECAFWFLSCSYSSTDTEEWRTHCLSHFRGEEPPKSVQCPLCDDFKLTHENGWVAWDHRQDHVASHHLIGHKLRTSRPDLHLFQHLWQKRLIDDQDLKELKHGKHNLSRPPNSFAITVRRCRHESRRRRHQHVGRRSNGFEMPTPPATVRTVIFEIRKDDNATQIKSAWRTPGHDVPSIDDIQSIGTDCGVDEIEYLPTPTATPTDGPGYTTRHPVPQSHHRHTSSASSYTTLSQPPSLYTTSESGTDNEDFL
jgi:hypothetical protein